MEQQGNAFSLFQTAINLENRVRSRTEELRATLRHLEQSNLELVAAKENAELANLSKTRFLAAASHDVLQPLNAAHLSVSALAELPLSAEGRNLVQQVERSLETMEDLLRTLLDISKLDAGVVEPEIGDVALEPLFASLKSDFLPFAENKGLRLRFRPTHALVRSDRTLAAPHSAEHHFQRDPLHQAGRCARRRPQPRRLHPDRYRRHRLRHSRRPAQGGVRGVSPRQRGRRCRALGGGLGLGLAIVRRMVDALGHRVDFLLDGRRGTAFHVEVPVVRGGHAEPAALSEPERPPGYGLFGTKVLMIENDAAVLEAMQALLERWRCDVRACHLHR